MKKFFLLAIISLMFATHSYAVEPIKIITSFSILEDMVKQVGGTRVEVDSLVKAGGDAHSFQPTAQDALRLTKTKIIFTNGLGFEPWINKLIKSSKTSAKIVEVSKNIMPLKGEIGHGHSGHKHESDRDPHAWNDIKNGIIYIKTIQSELSKLDPEGQEYYAINADTYIKELEKISKQAEQDFTAIPKAKRNIVMSHDSMGYFAKAYDIEVHSAQGLSTEIEPTAKEIAGIINKIRHNKITAIFLDSVANPKILHRISSETGVKIGGKLYSDSLSGANEPALSYKLLHEHNIKTVLKVLQ